MVQLSTVGGALVSIEDMLGGLAKRFNFLDVDFLHVCMVLSTHLHPRLHIFRPEIALPYHFVCERLLYFLGICIAFAFGFHGL